MKLLLTSTGITNKSLAAALKSLVKGKIRIAFIPTAANLKEGKKSWLIKNYNECEKLGDVDIVDIACMSRKNWLPRLRKANVIFVGGGDTEYLMNCMKKSGLKKEFPNLLKSRVYVGISAGSVIAAKGLDASSRFLYSNEPKIAPSGLGYVDFNVRPHLNSLRYPKMRDRYLKKVSKKINVDLYAIDDDSGILVNNGKIKIISEGIWKKY